MAKNILIAAVGGQGAVLAARVLGHVASEQGLEVSVSEIHGMSQRGGSVITHVRCAPAVHSPVIEAGTADVVMAFELLEAARNVSMLRTGGVLIVSTQQIRPLPVLTGAAEYPANLLERCAALPIRVIAVDGLAEAQSAGSVKTVNTVLLGAYARETRSKVALWHRAISACVRETHRSMNLMAFDRGYASAGAPARALEAQAKGAGS